MQKGFLIAGILHVYVPGKPTSNGCLFLSSGFLIFVKTIKY